jgi:hypothetical protein
MWEDWALFLKLASSGHRIGIIPQTDCLYRVRKQSMLRTYKVWPAMRRLASNMSGLSRYENFRLQAVMRHAREDENAKRSELNALHEELTRLREQAFARHAELMRVCAEHGALSAELNRRSVRVTRSIVGRLVLYPRAFGILRTIGARLVKTVRLIRNLTHLK